MSKNETKNRIKPQVIQRQKIWSEGVAVGSQTFVENVIEQLGIKGKGRSVHHNANQYQVKELACAYTAHLVPKRVF